METIDTLEELEALYGTPSAKSVDKVWSHLTPNYSRWIEASQFVVLTTVGPEGTDGSPRGDDGPVVQIADDQTLLLPDWRGNNRLDSLKNMVLDGRVSLMFMIAGSDTVVRVNGFAKLAVDPEITGRFAKNGATPKSVAVVTIGEVYFQCAKALMRAGLWSGEDRSRDVPTPGDFIREFVDGFDAKTYDAEYHGYAAPKMW